MKKGTRLEFYVIFLGALINLFFSIGIFGTIFSEQLWAAYYLVMGVALISLSFRLSNRRNSLRDSIFVILLGLLSLNPYLYMNEDLPFINPLPLLGGLIALIKSFSKNRNQSSSFTIPQKKPTLPPPRVAPKNKIIMPPAYKNIQNIHNNQRNPLQQHPLYRPQYSPLPRIVKSS